MTDELKTATDQIRDDVAAVNAKVTALQGATDDLAAKLQAAIANVPAVPDNSAVIAELTDVHAQLQALGTSVDATLAKDAAQPQGDGAGV